MHHIRPYRLFTLIDAPPPERVAHIQIPRRRAAGGVSLLETFLIIAATRVVAARRVFEFGTFLGSTTLNLALNTPNDAEILTLDVDEHCVLHAKQNAADIPIMQTHLSSKSALDFLGSPVSEKITALTGDSAIFDLSVWKGSVDCVFIDGGHDLATAKKDSENALEMVATNKPSCILWHDYRNPDYSALTGYLDELSRRLDIFHIEDTMLCAWFHDPGQSIRSHLLKTSDGQYQ